MAIENKIKASESDLQLARYDECLRILFGNVHKVFLTLTGEAPRSGEGWRPLSYSAMLGFLVAQQGPSVNLYFGDLCSALCRLVAVTSAARTDEGLVVSAFHDQGAPQTSAIATYIDEMRLQKIVQRIWMAELASKLNVANPWQVLVDETRGQALINKQAAIQDSSGYYLVGLQLQSRTLKAFCHPFPYPKMATEDQHRSVEEVLGIIRSIFKPSDNSKASNSRDRGFRSFSIASLPTGRKLHEWVERVRPQLSTLYNAFPAAQPLSVKVGTVD